MIGFLTSRLGRYLLTQTLMGILLTLLGVAAAVLLGRRGRTIAHGWRARTALAAGRGLPYHNEGARSFCKQTLPFVVLVGTMIALTRLNRRSELIAIRASGISAWRFVAPTAVVAALIGIASTTLLNPVASHLYGVYERETRAPAWPRCE